MSRRERRDFAELLARKAEEDATAVRELAGNQRVADSVVGFHAQQAVEKWLKAVLASRGVGFERTHDLDRLVELIEASDEQLPVDADKISALTEFAVPFRYDDPLEDEPFDREQTLEVIEVIGSWARSADVGHLSSESGRPKSLGGRLTRYLRRAFRVRRR